MKKMNRYVKRQIRFRSSGAYFCLYKFFYKYFATLSLDKGFLFTPKGLNLNNPRF